MAQSLERREILVGHRGLSDGEMGHSDGLIPSGFNAPFCRRPFLKSDSTVFDPEVSEPSLKPLGSEIWTGF